jgi:hypothetical protein
MADLQGWSRGTWGEGDWGEFIPVSVTGEQSNTAIGTVSVTADAVIQLTGVSSGVVLGTAIGEPESIYPLTGVQSNTATGTLEAQEGHGVIVTGVEMTFADGSEEIITTVDAGWGRNTWGSFAWGENITIFANLVGQQLSTDIGTVTTQTGTGVDAPVTGVLSTFNVGSVSLITDQNLAVTGLLSNVVLQNPTIIADGNVTTSAPGDQMDTAIGSVNINIFTQVDATAVTSTFETGTLGMSGDANFSLTGSQANTNVGTVTTVTGTGVNVATTGVSIQFAEGTETISGSAIVTPTGVEMSVVLGNMRSTPWANVVTGASNTWTEVAA